MGRRPIKSADEKIKAVLSVLRSELTQVEAARRLEISQTTIAKWQKQFLEGAREFLARGDNARDPSSRREQGLEAQIEELTSALGEADVELRVWRKGGLSTPVRRSRGNPQRDEDERGSVLRAPRYPRFNLALLAPGLPRRPSDTAMARTRGRHARRAGGREKGRRAVDPRRSLSQRHFCPQHSEGLLLGSPTRRGGS
jgi:transposase